MKEISMRRSLSERKLAKKERKEMARSAHFDRSLTPISIIGDKKPDETNTMSGGDSDYGTLNSGGGTLETRSRKNKFWKLKVSCEMFDASLSIVSPAPSEACIKYHH